MTCRWTHPPGEDRTPGSAAETLAAHHFTVVWDVPADVQPGTYRITHDGCYKAESDGRVHEFETSSRSFEVE